MRYYVVNRYSGMFFEEYDKSVESVHYTSFQSDAKTFSSRSGAKYWERKLNDGYGREKVIAMSEREVKLYM